MSERDARQASEDLGNFAEAWDLALAAAEAERAQQFSTLEQLAAATASPPYAGEAVDVSLVDYEETEPPSTPPMPVASAPLSPTAMPSTPSCFSFAAACPKLPSLFPPSLAPPTLAPPTLAPPSGLTAAPLTPPWRRPLMPRAKGLPQPPPGPPPQWMGASASSTDDWAPPLEPTPLEPTPKRGSPGTPIDWKDPSTIEIEKQITFAYGAKFKDRGPPAPSEGGPEQWRHQKWRESGNRWGNRGGKNKHVWTAFFAGKAKGEKAEGKMGVKAEGKKGDKAEGKKGDGKGAADKAGDDLEGDDKSGGGGMDDGSGGGWGSPNASS